jgi:hypothetical protein
MHKHIPHLHFFLKGEILLTPPSQDARNGRKKSTIGAAYRRYTQPITEAKAKPPNPQNPTEASYVHVIQSNEYQNTQP